MSDTDHSASPHLVPSGGDCPCQADAVVADAAQALARAKAKMGNCDDCGLNYCHCAGGVENAERKLVEAKAALRAAYPGKQNDGWRAVLQAHHDWHLAQGDVACGDGVINMADAYAESDLCDRTVAALRNALPTAAPSEGTGEEDYGTDALIDRFGEAIKQKLRAATKKYGWTANWQRPDWQAECASELVRHVGKGDPRDVAAYAAFAWHHNWSTVPTDAAPAPGHDGESEAAWLDEVERAVEEAGKLVGATAHFNIKRLIALARRTPAPDASVAAGRDVTEVVVLATGPYQAKLMALVAEANNDGYALCMGVNGALSFERTRTTALADDARGPSA